MSQSIIVTLISAAPPTVAALAAWRQVSRLTKPLNEVSSAVNHRAPGERRLVETVDYIATEIARLNIQISEHDQRLRDHLAAHQERDQRRSA